MKKLHLKKNKNKNIKLYMLLTIPPILFVITINIINTKISPPLINYAELEIKKKSNLILTKSVTLNSLKELEIDDLYKITKNDKNEILTIDINTILINKVIKESTLNILENLRKLEQGEDDIVLKIPLGIITNNFLFNDKGPKIPVKLKILGDLESKLNTKVTNYGINNALIEITLDISITEEVILPISTKTTKVTSNIPIALKMTNGTVPIYYSGEINKTTDFSIPIQ